MRELLVIADKDDGKQSAFYHALELAKNTGARIEFVGFVHAPGVDSSEILSHEDKRRVHHSYIDKKQAEIDDFLSRVDLGNVKVKTDAVWEKSFDRWVISRCDQKSFDMVFRSGKRDDDSTFAYTPSDWQLMRHCPESVMMVGSSPWKEGGVVLATLDLGSTSQKTLEINETVVRQATKFSQAARAELHVCYSMPIPKALADLDLINPKVYEKKMTENLDPIVTKLIEDAGIQRENIHLVSGKPVKEICRISEKIKSDVVFLGSKTRTSLRGRLMGNTAEDILLKVSADVVLVK